MTGCWVITGGYDGRAGIADPQHQTIRDKLFGFVLENLLLQRGACRCTGSAVLACCSQQVTIKAPRKIVGRLCHHALRYGSTLGLIAVEQMRSAPAFDHRRQLPAQVDRIAHAGVHAKAAMRAVLMHRITGQKHPAASKAGGHQATTGPGQGRYDFVLHRTSELLPEHASDQAMDIHLIGGDGACALIDTEPPQIGTIELNQVDIKATAFVVGIIDEVIERCLAFVMMIP